MKTSSLLVVALFTWASAATAAEPPIPPERSAAVKALRVYVAGESIEQYNRYVAPRFTARSLITGNARARHGSR